MFEVGLEFEVWSLYSINSVVVKYSKVTVMAGQNRYFKLRIPSQLHIHKENVYMYILI